MEIKTKKSEIVKALRRVEKAVAINSHLPVLAGIKFTAAKGRLTLAATNLEIAIQTVANVEVIREGGIVLPAKYIIELFKRMPDTEICIDSKTPGNATIFYGKAETNFNGYPPNEFPEFPAAINAKTFKISGSLLKRSIQRVEFASAEDSSQPVFCGILFNIEDNILTLVATDTFRLAIQKLPLENTENNMFIIPTKVLNEVSRLIEDDIEIKVLVSDRQAVFEIGNTVVISRLIEGRFPQYKQVIPNSFMARFTVQTRDLLDATDRTLLISSSGQRHPKIKMFLNGKLQILAENTAGKIQEEVPAEIEGMNGEEMVTVLNPKYLMDCLKASDVEKISINLTGSISPCMVRPVNDDSFFSIMVPTNN